MLLVLVVQEAVAQEDYLNQTGLLAQPTPVVVVEVVVEILLRLVALMEMELLEAQVLLFLN